MISFLALPVRVQLSSPVHMWVLHCCAAEGQAAARRAALLARCSPLTPELAAAAASHGTLLLVAADWGMFELFGVNWLTHVQRSGVDNYLMAALDQVCVRVDVCVVCCHLSTRVWRRVAYTLLWQLHSAHTG